LGSIPTFDKVHARKKKKEKKLFSCGVRIQVAGVEFKCGTPQIKKIKNKGGW
jgi:hypothetical protein